MVRDGQLLPCKTLTEQGVTMDGSKMASWSLAAFHLLEPGQTHCGSK